MGNRWKAPYLNCVPQLHDALVELAGRRRLSAAEEALLDQEFSGIKSAIRQAREGWEHENGPIDGDWPDRW
jgi:hypothetical protein